VTDDVERAELPLPSPELRFMREDDDAFRRIGDGIVEDMIELCALRADASVLDVGSGYGRVAHSLWRHGFEGAYLGLEILPRHVAWCSEAITPASGGLLEFGHLDVRNDRYNPGGSMAASEARFEVADGVVDVAVLTSVFTHMYAAEIVRYLEELRRVLRPGGRALTTFFMLDETWLECELASHSTTLPMRHALGEGCRYHNPDDPLHAIGYSPAWIRGAVADAGLSIYALRPGTWCGRRAARGYQDTVVLEAPRASV
jgi:SAM-dependent methyltransferase